ncbi:MAG: SDR family NAD(P)-dependent oxidoreductase [Proteobacteria bacterium]|nr:SDR family NAD(P)-dependent oxidoreductase [Pseudomonadota bacterium]
MPSVIITGCSSGIGLCLAQGLFARGWVVIATARQQEDVEQLTALGLYSVKLDVSQETSIKTALDNILHITDGRIDALVNNAGYGQPGAIEDLSRKCLQQQFETNFFGPFSLTNHILPYMRQQGQGRIINISSILGLVAMPYRGAYNASKFAIEAWSDTLRMELAGTGIEVSLIEPGPILSNFRSNSLLAFEANINATHSFHRNKYQIMLERLKKKGASQPFTLSPNSVLKKTIHALEASTPKTRYYVTFPTYIFSFLRHILPTSILDKCLRLAGQS